MAWTTPRTWVASELVTASLFNTHLRDNDNALRDYMLGAQDLGSNWEVSSGRDLRFSASGVAHGITTLAETDQYLRFSPQSATEGGAYMIGLSDVDRAGLQFYGVNGQAAAPTQGGIWFNAFKRNGTGTQAFASTELAMLFVNGGSTLGGFYGSGLNVVGGLSVGYSGTPTSGRLHIGDANFNLGSGIVGGPAITFDSGDTLEYNRTDNYVSLYTGSTQRLKLMATGFQGGGVALAGLATPVAGTVGFYEIADPTGLADVAYLYAKDNGAGKTQLVVIFGSGAVQVLATQP